MSAIKVPTNFNIDLEFEIPEFYRRLISLLIDFVILFFYIKIAQQIVLGILANSDTDSLNDLYNIQGLDLLIRYLPPLLYFLVCEILMNGQTIGKKIMNIRVVDENGGKASISQFINRWLLR